MRQKQGRLLLMADKDAVAAIEMGLITPVLILLVMGICDVGLGMRLRTSVGNSARAGVEYVQQHSYDSSAMVSAAQAATAFAISGVANTYSGCPSATGITVTTGNCAIDGLSVSNYAAITTTGTYIPMLSAIWPSSKVTFNATAVVRY